MNRGQSVVEMSLGMLVFVTILILGIHFAEVGYLSVKATEAAAHATWDATGMRAHRFNPGGSQFFNSDQMRKAFPAQNAGQLADAEYDDFDGREASAGGSLRQVFTSARGMDVSCRPVALATFNGYVNNPGNIETVFSFPRFNGRRVDGQSCSAETELRAFNFPRRFLEKTSTGGFFKENHYDRNGISVCAFGRPSGLNGACRGRLEVVLGDWGFAGTTQRNTRPAEWDECNPNNGCANQGYWRAVERLYLANGSSAGNASSTLAAMVSGSASPTNEADFHMVFRGQYSAVKEMHHQIPDESGELVEWDVTPACAGSNYESSYRARSQCFLGMPCSSGVF